MKLGLRLFRLIKGKREKSLTDTQYRREAIDLAVDAYVQRYGSVPSGSDEVYEPLEDLADKFKEVSLDPLEILVSAYEKNPSDQTLLRRLGSTMRQRGIKSKSAMEYYRRLVELGEDTLGYLRCQFDYYKASDQPYPLMLTAERIVEEYQVLREEGEDEDSAIDWEMVEEMYAGALQALAEIYVNLGKTDEKAMAVYREVLQLDGDHMAILDLIVKSYSSAGRRDSEAIRWYEEYLAYRPNEKELQLFLSEAYFGSSREAEGLAILKGIHKEDPQDAQVLKRIISYYIGSGQINEETLPLFMQHLKLNRTDRHVLQVVADYYGSQNSVSEEAVEVYKRVLPFTKERGRYLSMLGRYYWEGRQWSDVIEVYEELKEKGGLKPDIVVPLATAYAAFQRADTEALMLYERAVEFGCRDANMLPILSDFYFRTARYDAQSIACFKETLHLRRQHKEARLGLCQACVANGEYRRALEEGLRHLRYYPCDSTAVRVVAWCIVEGGTVEDLECLEQLDQESRRLILEELYTLAPDAGGVVRRLSEYYLREKCDDDKAVRVYEEALLAGGDKLALLTRLSAIAYGRDDREKGIAFDKELYVTCRQFCALDQPRRVGASAREVDCPEACVRLAQYYLEKNAVDAEAQEIYRRCYQKGDRSPGIVIKLAQFALDHEARTAEAIGYYQAAIQWLPKNKPLRYALMLSYIENNQVKPVLDFCRKEMAGEVSDPNVLDILTLCLSQCEEVDRETLEFLESVYGKCLDNEKLCVALALIYSKVKNYSQGALAVYEKALRVRPDDLELLGCLARCYEQMDDYTRSLEVYERIRMAIPDSVTITNRLAKLYAKMNVRSRESLEIVEQASREDPYDRELQLHLMEMLFQMGFVDQGWRVVDSIAGRMPGVLAEVLKRLEKMRETGVWSGEGILKMSRLYIEAGRYDQALRELTTLQSDYHRYCGELIDCYTKILEKDSANVQALIERGVIYKLTGRFEEAIADLEAASESARENMNVLYELAETYAAYGSAQKELDTGLMSKLGQLYFELGELDDCIATYQKVLEYSKESPDALVALGKCFHKKGLLEVAYRYYAQLGKTDEAKDLLYQLGDDFYVRGELEKAQAAYQEIVAVDITYRDVGMKVRELREEMENAVIPEGENRSIWAQLNTRARRRFKLLEQIGRGSMGLVFKAHDRELDEVVALKILPAQFSGDEEAVARFKQEAKSARRLTHPNIVRIFDIGEEEGRKYISMEFIDGEDLRQLITTKQKLSAREMLYYTIEIAQGLAYAHSMGILHRDIKPANVMITTEQNVKLTDFGIAAVMTEAQQVSSEIIVGTPLYMSPEQNEGKPCSVASDVYSLGVVMYEMLMGHPPFRLGNIAYHHIFTKPPAMKGVSKRLTTIVMRCLQKEQASRYSSMDELIRDLKTVRA
jgi:tetratricopeptide (TPR) repeat protein